MVYSLNVFNVWFQDQKQFVPYVFSHISLVGEKLELQQGTHKVEQKVILPLFTDSNTTHSNQTRKKL